MASQSPAFIGATPLRASAFALTASPASLCARRAAQGAAQVAARPHRSAARQASTPRASFKEDFFTGPSTPPRPRPLYQVILFSATTNLLWYGYYKFCIEEELRKTTGHGPGGVLALGPFVAGVTAPLYLPQGGPAEAAVAAGVLWIVSVQYWLYRRINEVSADRVGYEPLTPWWVVVPGFNLIVGLRSVHFLSVAWGFKADEDPVVARLPFLAEQSLSIPKMLTTPSLWLKL